jgi:DNA-binding MarR family transcriptional regulator
MKLEEEIQQTTFKSEHQKLLINIIYTGNWINQKSVRLLKKHNLTPQQFNILRILRGQRPKTSTIMLLQARMLDRMSNASRLVDKLLGKGFVDRQMNDIDRRRVDVTITDKGLALLKVLDGLELDDLLTALTVKESQMVNELLDKMRG